MATKKQDLSLIGKHVLITTSFRGVYYGKLLERSGAECVLGDARMAIYWGTTNGVDELAATGPTSKSKLGAPVSSVRLFGLTSISEASAAAQKAWRAAP